MEKIELAISREFYFLEQGNVRRLKTSQVKTPRNPRNRTPPLPAFPPPQHHIKTQMWKSHLKQILEKNSLVSKKMTREFVSLFLAYRRKKKSKLLSESS